VNIRRTIGLSGWIVLQALSAAACAEATRPAVEAPAIVEPAQPSQAGPGFSPDQRRRLQELKLWLAQRRQGRGQSGGVRTVREARALDLAVPDMSRRNLLGSGMPAQAGGYPATIYGRVRQRYVAGGSDSERAQSAAPGHFSAPPPVR
jgi:hypothetical protein